MPLKVFKQLNFVFLRILACLFFLGLPFHSVAKNAWGNDVLPSTALASTVPPDDDEKPTARNNDYKFSIPIKSGEYVFIGMERMYEGRRESIESGYVKWGYYFVPPDSAFTAILDVSVLMHENDSGKSKLVYKIDWRLIGPEGRSDVFLSKTGQTDFFIDNNNKFSFYTDFWRGENGSSYTAKIPFAKLSNEKIQHIMISISTSPDFFDNIKIPKFYITHSWNRPQVLVKK